MKSRRKDIDMTEGSIIKQLIAFAAPLTLGFLFQQLYNTVDTLVVGNYVGKEALAAVGSTGPIINTLIGLFMGFSIGTNVLISQYYGAHDHDSVHDVVHTTIMMTFILSVILTIVGVICVPYMLSFMNTPDDVIGMSSDYLRIYFCGIIGLLYYDMGSAILRAVGDSKRPLYFLVFSAIVNTVLDLVFVVYFGMGVAGVAWATVIAQILSALLILIVLSRTEGSYKLNWSHLHIDFPILKKIVKIGLPSSIQQGLTAFSNVFVQGYINNFGSVFMAGYSAYNKVDAVSLLPMQAIAMGSTTFVGQNTGAGNIVRAKKGTRISLLLAMASTGILIIPLMLFAEPIISIFNNDPGVIYYGSLYIRLISPFMLLCCVNQIYAGTLRGVGNTRAPMFIMLGSFVVFRQIYLYIVSHLFVDNYLPVIFAYPAGWVVCSLTIYIYYKHSHWEQQQFIIKNAANKAAQEIDQ